MVTNKKNPARHDVLQDKNSKIIDDNILRLLEDFVKSIGINSDLEYEMARNMHDMHIPKYLDGIAKDLISIRENSAQLIECLEMLQKCVLGQQKILALKIDNYIKG